MDSFSDVETVIIRLPTIGKIMHVTAKATTKPIAFFDRLAIIAQIISATIMIANTMAIVSLIRFSG